MWWGLTMNIIHIVLVLLRLKGGFFTFRKIPDNCNLEITVQAYV